VSSWQPYIFALLEGGLDGLGVDEGSRAQVLAAVRAQKRGWGVDATRALQDLAGVKKPPFELGGAGRGQVRRRAAAAVEALPPDQRDALGEQADRVVEGDEDAAVDLGRGLTRSLVEADEDLGLRIGALVHGAAAAPTPASEVRPVQTRAPGAVVGGKFVIKELLGRGGFGDVYRAAHQELGRDVALKVLHPAVARDAAAQRRFLAEVEAATSFVHKYAVQVREVGRDGDDLYFTMDLVEGWTLEQVLAEEGRLEPERAAGVGLMTLEALEEAHKAGLVHRDIKPANIMLTAGPDGEEEVRVLDFGIATAITRATEQETPQLTAPGVTVGTLSYMSPEQAEGRALDARSDVYSVGVVLYEALSGVRPTEPNPGAESQQQSFLMNLLVKAPPHLLEIDPGLPPDMCEVVHTALEKAPDARYRDAFAFQQAIREVSGPWRGLSSSSSPRHFSFGGGETLAAPVAELPPRQAERAERPEPLAERSGDSLVPEELRTGAGVAEASAQARGAGKAKRRGGRGPARTEPVRRAPAAPGSSRAPLVLGLVVLLAGGAAIGAWKLGYLERYLAGGPAPSPAGSPGAGPGTATVDVSVERTPGEEEPGEAEPSGEATATPARTTDPDAPPAELAELSLEDQVTDAETLTVTGRLAAGEGGVVRAGEREAAIEADGSFAIECPLGTGLNVINVQIKPAGGATIVRSAKVWRDVGPPRVELTAPADGAEVGAIAVVEGVASDDVEVAGVTVDGRPAELRRSGTFTTEVELPAGEGDHELVVVVTDRVGREATERRRVSRREPKVRIAIDEPLADHVSRDGQVRVAGRIRPGDGVALGDVAVLVDGVPAVVDAEGAYALDVRLSEGRHELEVVARVGATQRTAVRTVYVDDAPPVLRVEAPPARTRAKRLVLRGRVEDLSPWADVTEGNRETRRVRPGQEFPIEWHLTIGRNRLEVFCEDAAGHRAERVVLDVFREKAAPGWYDALPASERPPPNLVPGVEFRARPGEYFNTIDGTVLVWVPAGRYRRGSAGQSPAEEPAHDVAVRRGFFLGKHEVTWAQFREFCSETAGQNLPRPRFRVTTRHPVHAVTWAEARSYCRWAGGRLPTEAEWEWAARGSESRTWPWGEAYPDPSRGNLLGDADRHATTAPPGSFPAGAAWCGALDMAGNVAEWVLDAYAPYGRRAVRDPRGPAEGERHVVRGGGWFAQGWDSRAALRQRVDPERRRDFVGLRLCVPLAVD